MKFPIRVALVQSMHFYHHIITFLKFIIFLWKNNHFILRCSRPSSLFYFFYCLLRSILRKCFPISFSLLSYESLFCRSTISCKPSFLYFFRNIIFIPSSSKGTRPFTIKEHITHIVLAIFHQAQCILMVFFRFRAETSDHIAELIPQPGMISRMRVNFGQVPFACIGAVHQLQNACRSTLNGQMNILADVFILCNGMQHFIRNIFWMRSGKPYT